uniref:Uncharacterized protein n=1 Tax=Anguilla anguilla TaxID=7936 RepID=A0A0E9PWY9_ANGAN
MRVHKHLPLHQPETIKHKKWHNLFQALCCTGLVKHTLRNTESSCKPASLPSCAIQPLQMMLLPGSSSTFPSSPTSLLC